MYVDVWIFSGRFNVFSSLPLPVADKAQSLGKSQMAISLSLPWGNRKTKLRLPPPQPAVVKSWHYQDDREGSSEKPSPSAHLGQS